MNIRKTIQTQKNQVLDDKIKRVRIARSWSVRFGNMADRMTRHDFCVKYNFNVFTVSRYMNQSLAAVKALGNKKTETASDKIYLPSWEMIASMNDALEKEGV